MKEATNNNPESSDSNQSDNSKQPVSNESPVNEPIESNNENNLSDLSIQVNFEKSDNGNIEDSK